MLFNSFAFLFFFAIVVALYYFVVPHRLRWIFLLLASLYFYSAANPKYLLLLIFAILVAYGVGQALEHARERGGNRLALTLGILAELSVLVFFKYLGFLLGTLETVLQPLQLFSESIALPRLEFVLPVGLSFFTFSCISYLVDVYRGKLPAERHIGRLALYVSFFPKLLAGPIERAKPFLSQLSKPVRFDPAGVTGGLQLILWGLFKKVVIADRLAVLVDAAYQTPAFQSPVTLLVAVYLYAFQIYCDFSGYSDIAIGASRVLGFDLMENFRRPYFSTSVPEFWNARWHISLSKWFKDYLYIPMGGNRVPRFRWYFNQMVVFMVSGLWHGANWTFVVWGGLNGLYQVIYSALSGVRRRFARIIPLPRWLGSLINGLITFHLISIAWVFFRAPSISDATTILSRIYAQLPRLPSLLSHYNWSGEIILSVVLIGILLVIEAFDEVRSLWERLAKWPTAVRWAFYYAVIFALIILGKWGMTEFVYMQF